MRTDWSTVEWAAWQSLCAELQKAGAVTEEDLNSALGTTTTHGQRILTLTRHWGQKLVKLKEGVSDELLEAAREVLRVNAKPGTPENDALITLRRAVAAVEDDQ